MRHGVLKFDSSFTHLQKVFQSNWNSPVLMSRPIGGVSPPPSGQFVSCFPSRRALLALGGWLVNTIMLFFGVFQQIRSTGEMAQRSRYELKMTIERMDFIGRNAVVRPPKSGRCWNRSEDRVIRLRVVGVSGQYRVKCRDGDEVSKIPRGLYLVTKGFVCNRNIISNWITSHVFETDV